MDLQESQRLLDDGTQSPIPRTDSNLADTFEQFNSTADTGQTATRQYIDNLSFPRIDADWYEGREKLNVDTRMTDVDDSDP